MFFKKYDHLYQDDSHQCLVFSDLVKGSGIQSNQFLIIHDGHTALIDPGGDLTFAPLSIEIGKHMQLENLDYILASHQDPDIIAAMGRWMMQTNANVVCSKLWARFLPHLTSSYLDEVRGIKLIDRIKPLPDHGGVVHLGDCGIQVLPAHFLHSVGNFHFYDPISKILFSGDMGASMVEDKANEPVIDFKSHIKSMEGFHKRYMAGNKACRLWANMIRELDVEMMVPQHGKAFVGKEMINEFLDWISELECGLDLIDQRFFSLNHI